MLSILCCTQRVVLLTHDSETGRLSLRHYSIHSAPSGVTKGIKAVVAGTALPKLAQLNDLSELVLRSGYGSVSWLPSRSNANKVHLSNEHMWHIHSAPSGII